MSSQIDFRTLPANIPVMCIPRVYPNISESRIRRIFDDLNMGMIDHIDMVSKQSEKGEKFNRVFIHFNKWNNTENACIARERLLNGKEIKIIYDEPWFWKISAYREPEKRPEMHPKFKRPEAKHKKPCIQFDSDEERPRATKQANPIQVYTSDAKSPNPKVSRVVDFDGPKLKEGNHDAKYPRRNTNFPRQRNIKPKKTEEEPSKNTASEEGEIKEN